MNKPFKTLLLLSTLAAASQPVLAAGVGRLDISSQNDRFDNTGVIKADSESSGGVSTAAAAQRLIMPIAAGIVTYSSSGNQYRNSGSIQARSESSGGVSTAAAGQEVVL